MPVWEPEWYRGYKEGNEDETSYQGEGQGKQDEEYRQENDEKGQDNSNEEEEEDESYEQKQEEDDDDDKEEDDDTQNRKNKKQQEDRKEKQKQEEVRGKQPEENEDQEAQWKWAIQMMGDQMQKAKEKQRDGGDTYRLRILDKIADRAEDGVKLEAQRGISVTRRDNENPAAMAFSRYHAGNEGIPKEPCKEEDGT